MNQVVRRALLLLASASLLPSCGGSGGDGGSLKIRLDSQTIDSAGGTVSVTDPASPLYGTQIQIPAGALATASTITLSQVVPSNLGSDVLEFEIGPSGTLFSLPATVTVKYSDTYLADIGLADPTLLRMVERTQDFPSETLATTAQDTTNRTLTAQTTHLSRFAAIAPTKASLQGSYFFVGYQYELARQQPQTPLWGPPPPPPPAPLLPAPNGNASEYGQITFNGAGKFTNSSTRNEDGFIKKMASGSGTYSVANDGSLNLSAGFQGGVVAGGELAILASTGSDPKVLLLLKQGGSYSNATLNGTYFIVGRQYELAIGQPQATVQGTTIPTRKGNASEYGTITFNGSGSFSYSGTRSEDGVFTSTSSSGAYSITKDGTLDVAGLFSGGVLANGDVAAVASTSGDPKIMVFVRQQTASGNSTLQGPHFVVGSQFELAKGQPLMPSTWPAPTPPLPILQGNASEYGTIAFDGAGGFSGTTSRNEDGTMTSTSPSGSYTVASDGTLDLAGLFQGGVLSSGAFGICAATSGDPKILWFLK